MVHYKLQLQRYLSPAEISSGCYPTICDAERMGKHLERGGFSYRLIPVECYVKHYSRVTE